MEILLFLAFVIHLTLAVSHSLQYLYTAVTQGINFPEYIAIGLVDGDQFIQYNSNTRKRIPTNEWIKKVEDDDPDYWNEVTGIQQRTQEIFKVSLATAMGRFNHTDGVHTLQIMYGCSLDGDGTKRGYHQYGYDGEDFISLDLNTLTWTAANDKAVITKLKWEAYIKYWKNYLENTCIEWLQKYLSYGRDTLERKVPPEMTLLQKDSSSSVVCHATGFFPREVEISWKKNGEDLHENMELRETLRNQDETFQKRSILRVSPEELDKNEYTCVVQHSGLEKDLVIRVDERRVLNRGRSLVGVIVGVLVAVLFLVSFCVGFFIWMKKRNKKMTACNGESSSTTSDDCHQQLFADFKGKTSADIISA